MKIAFILPSLANKGPIIFTQYLIQGIKDKVDSIEVFYFKDIVELDLGVPTKQISLFERIEFDDFDIIHTHMLKADLYNAIFKYKTKNKSVSTIHSHIKEDLHDLYPPTKALLLLQLWKCILKNINTLIVSSEYMKNYMNNILKENKNYPLISYGIPKKELKPINEKDAQFLIKLRSKYKIIGSCGLLREIKGFKQLIEFIKNNTGFAVVLIGDGEDRNNLQALIDQYTLNDRFILLGFKNNSIDYYQYFDIYAMTSYSEGFGLSMLEAMSQGLPVVCSNLPVYEGYFNEKNVSLFQPNDIESLTNAIYTVNSNIEYYKQASHQLFREVFFLENMANKHIELYKKVIKDSQEN